METRDTYEIARRFLPAYPILFVTASGTVQLSEPEVSPENVGQKALGLSAIPPAWTLPFLSISSELHEQFGAIPRRSGLLDYWTIQIIAAAQQIGISMTDRVLIRSSGRTEGISGRGKFYSTDGPLQTLTDALGRCLEKLANDPELKSEQIPLIVQKRCEPIKARGHLSNERRCYEEFRDWMGEFEAADAERSGSFQINLRRWREEAVLNTTQPLLCAISPRVPEVLKMPAQWAYSKQARVHYEWVWDGSKVYVVQADEERIWMGHDPIEEHAARIYNSVTFEPQCIRRLTVEDAARFGKIRNVFTYLKLQLPIAPLYVLSDPAKIGMLANGKIPAELRSDIEALVVGSLVIRTDLDTDDLGARQLLPRTDEIRDSSIALEWMIEQSKRLAAHEGHSAFIFHNFIPSQAAAFAYAAPNEPLVQIEALWGLPEGLYYNAHDQYVVDTLTPDPRQLSKKNLARAPVRMKAHFKRYFVSTTESGAWKTLPLRPPCDWKSTLSESDCRRIAFESRRIAAAENRAISVMWFVGVPKQVASSSVIPWYHEEFDLQAHGAALTGRVKTSFDRCFVVQNEQDIALLQAGKIEESIKSRIRVQPFAEKLLRDKSTLRKIGEAAKAMGATIVLEGAVLSHAYYQLLSTGAIVEVVHPFIGFEEAVVLNKLVRDKVPEIVRERGEAVTTSRLDEESLVRALREKLVEEAFEALDAKDCGAIVAELADVKEVIESLLVHLKVSVSDLEAEQARKREARGGFTAGLVLVETRSELPTSKSFSVDQPHLSGMQPEPLAERVVPEAEVRRRNETPEKRLDRRVSAGKTEIQVSVSVPVTSGSWTAETAEERVKGTTVSGRVRASRRGNQYTVEVAVRIDETQPELL